MSAIFLKRFLQRPFQVASIIPSSRALVRRVADRLDFTQPRVIAEFGPGEGCHTREIVQRMAPGSELLLFELDPELAEHLARQFRGRSDVTVLNADAATLRPELERRGHAYCDYVVSGIPFSILEPAKKRQLLLNTHAALAPEAHAAFIIYQVTNELRDRGHCQHFARAESVYCLQNLPPMFVTKFYKSANGHAGNGLASNGHGSNGHARRAATKKLSVES
jgi:phosphatidylethanolamine/phosphatidyl-N-methylethanolamine N-methyltransferase